MPRHKWLEYKNFNGDFCDAFDDIPDGWRIAFGEQMVDDLNEILEKYNFADEYEIAQIKEKFGELRWYDNGYPREAYDEMSAWEDKYVELSRNTCIVCGAPGEMRMDSWISPYCDEHANGLMTVKEYAAKRKAEKEAKQKIENDPK